VERQKGDYMSWNETNRIRLNYGEYGEDLQMRLYIEANGRKIYREDIDKIIEYLEEKKYDFEMLID
jgi:hypothetical protein